METAQSLGLAGFITSIATIVAYLVKLNHKRIRSKCCNKDCTTSLDVEDTTPPNSKDEIGISLPETK